MAIFKNRILTLLALSFFASQAHSANDLVQRKLDGVWKLKSFICERGEQDPAVVKNQQQVEKGLKEETLTIKGNSVKTHTVFWENEKKKDSCTLEQKQTWEILDSTYRIMGNQVLSAKTKGTAKCPTDKENVLTWNAKPYIIDGKSLRLAVSDSTKPPEKQPGDKKDSTSSSTEPCKGGRWVVTYEASK